MSSVAESSTILIANQKPGRSGLKPYALSIGLHILLLIGVAAFQGPALLHQTVPVEVIYLPEGMAAAAQMIQAAQPRVKPVTAVQKNETSEIAMAQEPVPVQNPALEKAAHQAASAVAGMDAESNGSALGTGTGAAQFLTLKQQYILKIREQLERNKVYPRTAQKLRQTGKVMLLIEVQADGQITDRKVIEPARFAKLTEAAFALISSLDRLPPIPEELRVQSWQIQVPVEYELR